MALTAPAVRVTPLQVLASLETSRRRRAEPTTRLQAVPVSETRCSEDNKKRSVASVRGSGSNDGGGGVALAATMATAV